MSLDFDPYRNWLGIPTNEPRPINYYRLCGLELFESDADIISLNADKQLDYIRRFSQGPQGDVAERLLNEISRAKLTLLKPERRFDYDLQLRRTLAQTGASNNYAPQPAAPQPYAPQPYAPQQFAPQQYAPQPAVTQPAYPQPSPPQPTAAWPVPQQYPGPVPYPAPPPQPYAAPGPQSYSAPPSQYSPSPLRGFSIPGEAYPSAVPQPGAYQAPAPYEAPVAHQSASPFETPAAFATAAPAAEQTAPAEEDAANPFSAFGGAPQAPNAPTVAAGETAKPVRKSATTMWAMIGSLIAVGITLVVLLKSRTERDSKNTAAPQAKASSKQNPNQTQELTKKVDKAPLPVPPIEPGARSPLKDIPNAVEKTFEHKITMQDDWKKYLHWSQNVEVHHETDKIKTSYWRPSELNKEGALIYFFPVDFFIREGTLQTTLVTNMVSTASPSFDRQAYLYLEVSPDGKQWQRIDGLEQGRFSTGRKTLDIGKYVQDSRGVYIKALLFSSKIAEGGKSTAQFLRAYPNTRAPVFTLSLRGLQPGPAEPEKPEFDSPIGKMASVPKRPLPPLYEEVVVEPPAVPTAADLIVKTTNDKVQLALQEWYTAREAFLNLKKRDFEQYLGRFNEEIKQYQSSTVMKAEVIKDFVESLAEEKEIYTRLKLYSLAHSMLPHNQVISNHLKEQTKLEKLYDTLIGLLRGDGLAEKATAYEAMKYHDELLQPIVLSALSYKKTPNSPPEILCLCSNSTINLEPKSKWRIDRKMTLIFNRGDDSTREYSFTIEPNGRTMKETSAVSVATLEAHPGPLPVLKKPPITKRVPVQR